MKIHIVKNGDTLYELAKKHNVDLEKLIALNPHIADPDQIDAGTKVKIPSLPKAVEPQPIGDIVHKHIVQQGDTIWQLSKKWNVPLMAIIQANPHLKNPNVLLSGDTVFIPKIADETGMDMTVPGGIAQTGPEEMAPPLQFAEEIHMGQFAEEPFAQFKVPAAEAVAGFDAPGMQAVYPFHFEINGAGMPLLPQLPPVPQMPAQSVTAQMPSLPQWPAAQLIPPPASMQYQLPQFPDMTGQIPQLPEAQADEQTPHLQTHYMTTCYPYYHYSVPAPSNSPMFPMYNTEMPEAKENGDEKGQNGNVKEGEDKANISQANSRPAREKKAGKSTLKAAVSATIRKYGRKSARPAKKNVPWTMV